MSADVKAPRTMRTRELTGEAQEEYIRRLRAIIRAARLNNHYPDGRRLSAHVGAMSPEVHRGVYDRLEINLDSGLPTYREFTRVQTDVSIATDQMKKLGSRSALLAKVRESEHAVHARQLAKYDYFDEIADVALAPMGAMEVALRRVDARHRRAYFYVIFDKLEASGEFVRYRIELAQTNAVWNAEAVKFDEETESHSEEFKALIYRFSSLDAEFTFAKIADLSGVEVQSVSRTTLGPIYFVEFGAPKGFGEPFDGLLSREGDFVAMFAIETAGKEVREARDNDPFYGHFQSDISRSMAPHYALARQDLDYRVYRDRKFVVSRGLDGALREVCAERNTRNVIYSI